MKKSGSFKIAFPVASVWFGALVGPSMISGVFAASYFAPYGVAGLLLPMLSMGLAAFIIAMGAEVVRKHKVYNYYDYANCLYGKLGKVLTPVLEIYMIIAMIVGGSAVVSMGGIFFSDLTHLPKLLGSIIVAIISIVLVLWGDRLVRASSALMSVVMIAGMILLSLFAVINRGERTAEIVSSFYIPEGVSLWAGVSGAIALGLSNACNALTLSAVEQNVEKPRHSAAIGVCSFILNSCAFILSTLLLLPYCPDALKESVPVLSIVNSFLVENAPWLPAVYSVTMFLALLSSGAPQLHAVVSRIRPIFPKKGVLGNSYVSGAVIGVIYFACCIFISRVGLQTIISKGYSMLGYLAIPLIVIPVCILMPLRGCKKSTQPEVKQNIQTKGEQAE